jgi:phenylacetate-CoA ligase
MAVQAEMLTAGLRREGHVVINVPTNALAHGSAWRRIPLLRGMVNLSLFLSRLWPACFKADVVHVFSNSYLSFFLFTFPAVAAGKVMGKRVILHYHGGSAGAFLKRWFWLARLALEVADRIVVPSGFLSAVFLRHHLRTAEIPNILELDNLPFRERALLQPHVIMARHLEPDYNVACGLRVFALLRQSYPQATLTIAGDGSEKAMLVSLCHELGIADGVTFTGNIENSKMKTLYDRADIYLNTSRVDNQPVSILEAFACGLPVVSTAVGGIPCMARHGEDAMLAPDDDAAQLAAHMVALLQDRELSTRLIQQARQHIQEHSWAPIYSKLLRFYHGESPA